MGDEGEDRLPSLPEAESPEPGARGRGGLEGGREGLETRASMATGPTARAPVRDGDSSAAERLRRESWSRPWKLENGRLATSSSIRR